MEIKLISLDGKETGKKKLPVQFSEPLRALLISRAVEAIQSHKRQRYGTDPRAGKRASANLSRRRRNFKTSYGKGISRVPRKTMSRRGTQFFFVGAFAPGTVGGRRAHPPKAEKVFRQKINDKERRKALRSALSATMSREIVERRGHKLPAAYPFAVENKFEALSTTIKVEKLLSQLGFSGELMRSAEKKVRAGKGKGRGRKYKKKKGLLIVVSARCPLLKASRNIPGLDIVEARNINAELLAPGGMPGRLSLFTDGAISKISEGLFK